MAIKYFVTVTAADKIECTVDYLQGREDVSGWPKRLKMTATSNLKADGYVYLTINDKGGLGCTLAKPQGVELSLQYTRSKWSVSGYEERPEIVEMGGKHYYKEELEEALRGLEVQL